MLAPAPDFDVALGGKLAAPPVRPLLHQLARPAESLRWRPVVAAATVECCVTGSGSRLNWDSLLPGTTLA